jgi:hypothetical protein
MRFRATGGQPGAGFLIFGVSLLNLPIPPTNCRLLTDIIIPVLLPSDPGGTATFEFTIDRLPTGITFYTQFIQGSYVGCVENWRTSDGNLIFVSP